MAIHLEHGDIHLLDLRTRMPFKYGIATMTSTPHAIARLPVQIDGKPAIGLAADHLPPKWFTKDPARPIDAEVQEMLRVIEQALRYAAGIRAATPFDAWQQLFERQASWGRAEPLPPLLTHFGTSLVERALIDATCRSAEMPFSQMLRTNQLGIRLGDIHPALAGRAPSDLLPERPLTRIIARHTVGMADPLRDADIASAERLDDGLPQSLEACIKAYGLRHFKIKVSGAIGPDRDRLRRIAEVIESQAGADFAFSLDGNEQFVALAEFQAFWSELIRLPELRPFFTHLLFVEQPFHRSVALDAAVVEMTRSWPDRPALIIDESDGELESLPQALRLGYAGTSHKNCKGVFKGIANACLLAQLRRDHPARPVIMSGEDLANIGPVALLQDLAVVASLGITSVERNGHHYFAGLSMFPAEVQQQILAAHGDLYHRSREGWPTLTVSQGMVQVASVIEAPFGVKPVVKVDAFPMAAAWREAKQRAGC